MNNAVGILREQAFCALLNHIVGEENIDIDLEENQSESDAIIFGEEISIKTAMFNGRLPSTFKMCWTANRDAAEEYIRTWHPEFPIIYLAINWNTDLGGIYYIPIEAIENSFETLGRNNFFQLLGGNPRGVPVTRDGLTLMLENHNTIRIPMAWRSQYHAGDSLTRWLAIIEDLVDGY